MVKRRVSKLIQDRLTRFPAVALIGARQSGKTTLAGQFSARYYDLEQPGDQTRLDAEWDRVTVGRELIVLDEAQAWPVVFPRLRSAIDSDRKRNGRFLILGSLSPSLMTQVSESLAGRLSLVELTAFVTSEIEELSLDDLWLRGALPDGCGLHPAAFPQWQHDYLALLTQRDLPVWGLPAKPHTTGRLVAMLAAVTGQTWNATQVANSLGISRTTVNTYLDYLEGAFLIRRLPAYRANLRKRLTKSPKIHWRDSGLLHATMNVSSFDELLRRPAVLASWEGFVIGQVLDTLSAYGIKADAFYLRTSDGYKIDLIVDRGSVQWAVEVKLTSSPSPEDLARLRKTAGLIGVRHCALICRVKRDVIGDRDVVASLPSFLNTLVGEWTQDSPPAVGLDTYLPP
jgi:hypothetical protein